MYYLSGHDLHANHSLLANELDGWNLDRLACVRGLVVPYVRKILCTKYAM